MCDRENSSCHVLFYCPTFVGLRTAFRRSTGVSLSFEALASDAREIQDACVHFGELEIVRGNCRCMCHEFELRRPSSTAGLSLSLIDRQHLRQQRRLRTLQKLQNANQYFASSLPTLENAFVIVFCDAMYLFLI
jgi:hypothetical protein